MSKELRALAIVFGVLAGLVVLGFVGVAIAFTVFAKHVASQPRDPAALLRTARKIATFDVPHGYVVSSAADLGISVSATVQPAAGDSSFRITLEGSPFPSSAASQASGAEMGLAVAERLVGCTPGHTASIPVTVHGAREQLHVMRCVTKDGIATQAEFVSFPGNTASASLSAVGTGGDFDAAAVRELLASIR